MLGNHKLFFIAFVISFAARILSWILEAAQKGDFVERAEGDKVRPV